MPGALSKRNQLLGAAALKAAEAREIFEKAQGEKRELTEDEHKAFQKAYDEAVELKKQADTAKLDEQVVEQAKALADLIGMPEASKEDLEEQLRAAPGRDTAERKSLGEIITQSPQFKAAVLEKFAGRPIPQQQRVAVDPIEFKTLISGAKALWVGGSQTSAGAFLQNERTDIVEGLGRRPLTIRDLISVRRTQADTVEYVTQTSHTNAAAPVAEATSSAAPTTGASAGAALTLDPNGGYKPEGAWAYQENTATVKTLAEWVPATKRSLSDVGQLEGLINDELVRDLAEVEESQILTGNGTGQNLPGILNTSGIQTTAAVVTNDATWFGSFRTALRLARTVGRVNPTAVVVNPAQGEKIDTAKDAQNRFYGPGPFFADYNRRLWGMPVIESEAITAGTALVGDFSKAVLWDREQANVSITDSHADFFIRNLVAILAEERVAFAVTRPTAFVTVTGL